MQNREYSACFRKPSRAGIAKCFCNCFNFFNGIYTEQGPWALIDVVIAIK